jgi:YD repeat-containing protein
MQHRLQYAIAGCFVSLSCLVPAFSLAQTAATQTMAYDQLGRLIQINYPGGVSITYVYDAAGNRTSYMVTGSTNVVPQGSAPIGQTKAAPSTDEAIQKPG